MHIVDELRIEAEAAIAAMREAAVRARDRHALAELMRHMRSTAAKVAALPLAEAAARVTREWMQAWHLDGAEYAALADEARRFALAFCRDAAAPDGDSEAALRTAIAALEAAFARAGTGIADQMAWRSQCAHGWWEMVAPTPADLPFAPQRSGIPAPAAGAPFWTAGCAARCLG